MAISAEVLETEALSLPRDDKARLIVHLLESIDERPSAEPQQVEQAWLAEANRRYKAYLRGDEQAISSEEIFSDLRDDDR